VDPQNLPAILQKDAIYNSVGLAAFDLYDEIDFDAWLTSSLSLELQVKVQNFFSLFDYDSHPGSEFLSLFDYDSHQSVKELALRPKMKMFFSD
jgi:hypothetical protein